MRKNIILAAVSLFLLKGTVYSAGETANLSLPQVGKLPVPTQMHGTAVIGERLYILGGENASGWSNTVYSAPVGGDGKVGAWRSEVSLPVRISYLNNSLEVVGNRIYIIGGTVAADAGTPEVQLVRNQEIFWTETGEEGVLNAWRKAPGYPGPPLAFMGVCSNERMLLATGGSTRQQVHAEVYAADLSPSGEPASWRVIGRMPGPLWQHGAALLDDRLYVWGGINSRKGAVQIYLDPAPIVHQVWSAPLAPDGRLGEWREERPMPQATFGAACAGFNDYLVSIGGRYGDKTPTNSIWFSHLKGGRADFWQLVRTDLQARVYHSLGLDQTRGWIFVTGGQIKTVAGKTDVNRLDAIQAFVIPQPDESRLSSRDIAAAGASAAAGGVGAATDFKPITHALDASSRNRRPVLALFYSPQVPACRRFWENVARSAEFLELGKYFELAAVDISGPEASFGPRFKIFRVPALAVIAPDGSRQKATISLRTMHDVNQLINTR